MAYVYKHIRLDKNEPFYIGIGFDNAGKYKRAHCARGRNNIWGKIVNKTKYIVEIIEDGVSNEEIFEREKYWIKVFGRLDNKTGILSNLTDGGEATLGWIPSDETRKKISEAKVGRVMSDEFKQKISKATKGHKYNTPEVRKKISDKHKQNEGFRIRGLSQRNLEHLKRVSENNKGKPTWNKGIYGLYTRSDETKRKMSEAQRGKIITQKQREQISITHKSKPKVKCPYCNNETNAGNLGRWHGEKCKSKNNIITPIPHSFF
jgi:hypothetical protein